MTLGIFGTKRTVNNRERCLHCGSRNCMKLGIFGTKRGVHKERFNCIIA